MSVADKVRAADTWTEQVLALAEGIDLLLARRRPSPPAQVIECSTPVESTDVLQVFEGWQRIMDRQRAQLTRERKEKIKARLKEGKTLDRFVRAFQGCEGSDFHMARGQYGGKGRTIFNDITLICRTPTDFERFEEMPRRGDADAVILRLQRAKKLQMAWRDNKYQSVFLGAVEAVGRAGEGDLGRDTAAQRCYRLLDLADNNIDRAIELRREELLDRAA